MAIGIAVLFVGLICALVARGMLPLGVLVLYLAASVMAAVGYRVDKSAAQSGGRRKARCICWR